MEVQVHEKKTIVDKLEFYVFNASSIRGDDKLLDFNSHFSGQDYHIISIAETWLNESIFDQEILVNGQYQIFRRDRDLETVPDKKDGGGVMLAVSSSIPAKRRHDLEEPNIELLWVEVNLGQRRAYIGTVYMNYPNVVLMQALECSLDRVAAVASPNDIIMCMGDYNSRDISWDILDGEKYATATNKHNVCPVSDRLLEVMDAHDMLQFNSHATCNDNVLDLVFACNVNMDICIADKACSSIHNALSLAVNIKSEHHFVQTSRTTFNFQRADWEHMIMLLSLISWNNLAHFPTVNDALSHFYDIIYAVIIDCVPMVTINTKKFPFWYDRELITMVKEKEKYRKMYINNGRNILSNAYSKFCSLRKDVKYKQRHRFLEYTGEIGNEMKTNPKKFWTHVKSLKLSMSLPPVMSFNGVEYCSIYDIVNKFNAFFRSVLKYDSIDVPHCSISDVPRFIITPATPAEVLQFLKSLNPHSSSGFSNIPAKVLIKCADQLCYPLCEIFNLSVSRGEYPNLLKFNNVLPIFKSGDKSRDKSCVESYRGISIQPIIAKLFESLVSKRLKPHIKHLITDEQHGFQPNKSTFSNLACYTDFITSALNDKCEVHSVYTDFSKAFDVVPHNLLLLKMSHHFGIDGLALVWFTSYLTDRFQRVVLSGVESDWIRVTSGVPQGSILGPKLFLMYVNDIPAELKKSKSSLFADDSKLFRRICSIIDCTILQSDLDLLHAWCSVWKISLNVTKCYSIAFTLKRKNQIVYTYSLGNKQLKNVSNIKDLGVYLSSDMSFSYHVNFITKKANRMLGFVRRVTKPFKDSNVLCSLYKSLVRSGLEYCSSIWSPSQIYLISKIERVQKRVVKWLCYKKKIKYESSQYPAHCKTFGLQPLENRRTVSDFRNFNKILCNKFNCTELVGNVTFNAPSRLMRSNPTFSNHFRINLRKNSFIPRVQALSDHYTEINIFESNAFLFKRNLENYFY